MIKKFFCLILFFFVFATSFSQNSGKINYTVTSNWSKMMENCNYLSQSERQQSSYVWGTHEWSYKSTLKFNPNVTLYELIPNENNGWSSRQEDFYMYRNLENSEMLDIRKSLGSEYVIIDSLQCLTWKIRNDMKEIVGHICMNAYFYDTLRNKEIVAWFALDMPYPIGPYGYCGLPGVILELDMNNGAQIITATSIIPDENIIIEKPIYKKKSKIIKFSDYQEIEKKAILDAVKMRRPYFWSISY